jgi:RimJ/RimL family protein N-acetyltransferase
VSAEITTTRLLMRPPRQEDFESWAAFDGDADATRFFGGPKSRAVAWDGLAMAVGMWSLRGCGLFSVIERETGQWVGRVGPWVPEGPGLAEVGWAILPSRWGRGYAGEAAEGAVAWVFDQLNWDEARHRIDTANLASIAVAQRIGSRWLREETATDGHAVQVYGQSRAQSQAR